MPFTEILINGEDKMEKAILALKKDLSNVRTGRANPMVLDRVTVEYYGAPTPLRQLANVTVQEGTTLVIQPFDKNILKEVEKAIQKSDIGITPNNDGSNIRISFPPLTEDRRKELVKTVKKTGEDAKISIRNIRRDMTDTLKKAEKEDNLPEDVIKDGQNEIQKITDKFVTEIDNLIADKEKEVLTV